MIAKSEHIQFHYECAMSIGTSLDLKKMLRTSLKTILRKLNCPVGGVHFFDKDKHDIYHRKRIFSIPRETSQIEGYQAVLEHIPTAISPQQLDEYNSRLPLIEQSAQGNFHILELPNIGVVVLLRNSPIDSMQIKSMGPILVKLAAACTACMQNEELIEHRNNLQKLVAEKTDELVSQNQQLHKEIDNRLKYAEALSKSEAKYRELVENANSIILRWDTEGRVTFFNEYAQVFFDYREEEILGKHVVGTIVPENESTGRDLRSVMDDICINPQKYRNNVNENIRKDGSRVWIAWTNKVLNDEKGDLVGVLSIGSDVTEQRESEQRFKIAAEAMSDLIYEWDMNNDSLRWFGDIESELGFEHGEFPHTLEAWINRIHPDDLAKLADAVEHHRTSTNPINYEYRIQQKDGIWIYWSDYGVPILGVDGKPKRWIGACTNITDKKKAELELIESEARYLAIFTNEIYAICIFEVDTSKIVDVNDAWLKLYGYQRNEIEQLTIKDVTAELESTKKAVKRSTQVGTVFIPKRHHLKKDGTTFFVELSAGPFTWKGRQLMYAFTHDITDRIRTENRLMESEQMLAETQKIAKLGSWEFEVATGEIIWSEETFRIAGIEPRDKLTLNEYMSIVHPDDHHLLLAALEKSNSDKTPYEVELRHLRPDKTCNYTLTRGMPVIENDKVVKFKGSVVDITELKKSEQRFKLAAKAAEDANKAKSTFLANMSHEIRTPMNAVLGFSELLEDLITDRQQKQYLDSIMSSGKTLLSLINDVLDISKIEAGKLELQLKPVNLQPICEEIKNAFTWKTKEKNLNFVLDIDKTLPCSLLLDEIRIRQILVNLVGNAVKFTEKGYVRLSLSKQFKDNDESAVDLVITIEDTGIGIPVEQKEMIFEAFRQQDAQNINKFGGTGLGLTITKRVVEILNGELSVESELGKGSKFEVKIKNVAVASVKAKEYSDDFISEVIKFQEAKVLIVDDIDVNRSLLINYLEPYNFDIIEAEDGKETIDLALSHKPDLILLDMKMPVMDGYEATKVIKSNKKLKHIPIVAVTASSLKGEEKTINDIGCNGLLRKPVTRKQLIEQLKGFLSYTVSKDEISGDDVSPEDVSISDESKVRMPELLKILENDIFKKFEKLKKTFVIDEIEDFAVNLKELGKAYGINILSNFGDRLSENVKSFDVEQIQKILDDFPEMIEKLKNTVP